ncbi:halocyanin domain-containing protein [Haloferacaceae archaeon DSL9]
MSENADVSRRGFLRTAAGTTAAAGATAAGMSGIAVAQEDGGNETEEGGGNETEEGGGNETEEGGGNETEEGGGNETEEGGGGGGDVEPDWGGYLDGIDGGTEDARGQEEVTVTVGGEGNGGDYAFSPAGLWVDPGTTVTWEWTGDGGDHNVEATDGPAELASDLTGEAGFTYEFTFEEDHAGITEYHCAPHDDLGMLGAVAVGEDIETQEISEGGGGGGGGGAPMVPDAAKTLGVATFFAMGSTLAFAFFFLKYGGDYEVDE